MLIVHRGIPGTAMPPNNFTDTELKAVVGYVRSLHDTRSGALHGDAQRGQIVFESRGDCLNCHRVGSKGGYSAADLSDIGTIRSVDSLEKSLLDPALSDLPEPRLVRAVRADGVAIAGRRLNEDTFTVQLIDSNGRLVSLVKRGLRSYEAVKGPRMPSYRDKLSRAEVDDLVSYLASLKGSAVK